MEYRRLGNSGLLVSEISLGSWLTFGSSVDAATTEKIVHSAYDMGVNLFDTADVYASGSAEEALGRALQGIPRPYVVIATKCYYPMSESPNDRGLSRKHISESVDASLRRLGTDYLDLHQCHRPDPGTPMEETVRAYEDLIRQGKVLYWGVSEWSAEQVVDACRIADGTGGYRPVSNQPQYSIMRRQLECDVLPVCEREGVGQIVFSPLGQGVLTGKYGVGDRPGGTRAADEQRNRWMEAYLEPQSLGRVEALRPVADELGISMAQLALIWCLRQPSVSSVIVGSTRVEQVQENCNASGIALSDEHEDRIEDIFPAPGALVV